MTLWRPAGHIKDKMLRQAINAQALVRNQILIGEIATIKKKLTSWKSDLIFRPPTHETQRFKCFVISTISTLSRHLNPHPLDINPSMKPSRSWKWWLMSHIISDYVKTIRCCDKDSPTPPTHCRAKNSHRNFFFHPYVTHRRPMLVNFSSPLTRAASGGAWVVCGGHLKAFPSHPRPGAVFHTRQFTWRRGKRKINYIFFSSQFLDVFFFWRCNKRENFWPFPTKTSDGEMEAGSSTSRIN